ncbi:unnamed protein product [Paramecium sonneborni]|uniref:Uncharacterized protein n=1 Tax=Paramecium sonneborni TaxID=65129 RepID=A0A8S1KTP6_9CILI|nr:unnamed protein product [Paramecium sonneborni]
MCSNFREFFDVFSSIEPQFNLDYFIYEDEEKDIITISNEEDFSCFLNSSIQSLQAQGNYKSLKLQQESERNLILIQNFKNKSQIFAKRLRQNLLDKKMYYEHYLYMIKTLRKLPIEQQQLYQEKKLILIKIEDQNKSVEQSKQLKMRTDKVCDFFISNIYSIIDEADKKITYNESSQEEFNKNLDYISNNLVEQISLIYQNRYNKLIEIRERQMKEIRKMIQLKKDLYKLKIK